MGQILLAENESHIYPNMCAKFGCGPTVVSKKKGVQTDRQTDKGTLQLYIVDIRNFLEGIATAEVVLVACLGLHHSHYIHASVRRLMQHTYFMCRVTQRNMSKRLGH